MKQYAKSLFIFHRDLRIADNRGLICALSQSAKVIPCFIFDPIQVGNKNYYRSSNCIQFMITSLQELDEQLHKRNGKLYLFNDDTRNLIKKLIKEEKIDAIFCNRDYTPFAATRDKSIEKLCHENGIDFIQKHDLFCMNPSRCSRAATLRIQSLLHFIKKHSQYQSVNLYPRYMVRSTPSILVTQNLRIFIKKYFQNLILI